VVVGTGFGTRVHVPALRAAGFRVDALVGRDAARTARRAYRLGVPKALTDLDDALALPGVAAVTIATPPGAHAPAAIAAARAGKHVICEKPFALDAREAEAMLAAAEQAGIVHLVGHEFRWAPERVLVARAIADGSIGEPRLVTLVQHVPLVADPDARVPPWWFDAAAGGGWLGASGSHVVDMLRVWLGEVAEVSARLGVTSARVGVAEDTFTVTVRFRSGADGVLQQTAAAWGPMAGLTRVAGTTGTLWIDGEAVHLADAAGTRQLPVPAELALPSPPEQSDDPRHRFTHLELGPYTRLCEALRAGVDGRPLPDAVPLPTFADGVACMRVLDAIRTSSGRGGSPVEMQA
jgi:predicted dehydrogenase